MAVVGRWLGWGNFTALGAISELVAAERNCHGRNAVQCLERNNGSETISPTSISHSAFNKSRNC
jgi:hypothetical protein